MTTTQMDGIREYGEGDPVELHYLEPGEHGLQKEVLSEGRWVVCASNEGGCAGTVIDLFDLIAWLRANKPDLLEDK